jgi:hypothetical protein
MRQFGNLTYLKQLKINSRASPDKRLANCVPILAETTDGMPIIKANGTWTLFSCQNSHPVDTVDQESEVKVTPVADSWGALASECLAVKAGIKTWAPPHPTAPTIPPATVPAPNA